MRNVRIVLLAVMAAGLLVTGAFSQGGGQRKKMYDPKTVGTFTGAIVAINTKTARKNAPAMLSMILKTEKERLGVMLGPASYVKKQSLKLAVGDEVAVVGSRVTVGEREIVMAAEIWKGENVLRLRSEDGTPLWMGGAGKPAGGEEGGEEQ